jgi:hypothetical protein
MTGCAIGLGKRASALDVRDLSLARGRCEKSDHEDRRRYQNSHLDLSNAFAASQPALVNASPTETYAMVPSTTAATLIIMRFMMIIPGCWRSAMSAGRR